MKHHMSQTSLINKSKEPNHITGTQKNHTCIPFRVSIILTLQNQINYFGLKKCPRKSKLGGVTLRWSCTTSTTSRTRRFLSTCGRTVNSLGFSLACFATSLRNTLSRTSTSSIVCVLNLIILSSHQFN